MLKLLSLLALPAFEILKTPDAFSDVTTSMSDKEFPEFFPTIELGSRELRDKSRSEDSSDLEKEDEDAVIEV